MKLAAKLDEFWNGGFVGYFTENLFVWYLCTNRLVSEISDERLRFLIITKQCVNTIRTDFLWRILWVNNLLQVTSNKVINSANYFFNHVYLRSFISQTFFEWLLISPCLCFSCFFSPCLRKKSVEFSKATNIFMISKLPYISLCIQLLDKRNNSKNNRLPLGPKLCFTIV